jgi:hypothetical protein
MNAWSFEDHELGIIKLKKRVLQTLFSWRVSWHSSHSWRGISYVGSEGEQGL